jgi:hypothetical protein
MTDYQALQQATAAFRSSGENLSLPVNTAAELLGVTPQQLYNYLNNSIKKGRESKSLKGAEPAEISINGRKNTQWGVTPLMFVGLIKHYSLYAKVKTPKAIEMMDALASETPTPVWLSSLIDQPSQENDDLAVGAVTEKEVAKEIDKIIFAIKFNDEDYLYMDGNQWTLDKKVIKDIPSLEVSKEESRSREGNARHIVRQVFEAVLGIEIFPVLDPEECSYSASKRQKLVGKLDRDFFQNLFGWEPVSNILLTAQDIEELLKKGGRTIPLFHKCVEALLLHSHEIPSVFSLTEHQELLIPIKDQATNTALGTNLFHAAFNKETCQLAPGSMEVFEKFHNKELNYSQSIALIANIKKQLTPSK